MECQIRSPLSINKLQLAKPRPLSAFATKTVRCRREPPSAKKKMAPEGATWSLRNQ
jgi:hypothetical protein